MKDITLNEHDLLAWLESAEALLERLRSPSDTERSARFTVLFGIAVQAVRAGAAYGVLHRGGRGRAGNAVARAALEAGVVLQWAAIDGDRVKRQINHSRRSANSYFNRIGKFLGDPLLTEAIEKSEKELIAEGKGIPPFATILRAVDTPTRTLNTPYTVMSQFTHVTGSTVASAIAPDGSQIADPVDPNRLGTLYAAAMGSMLALVPMAELQDDDRLLEELEAIWTALNLPSTVQDDDLKASGSK